MHPEQHPCRLEPRPRQALAATLLFRKYCLSVCNDTPVSRPYSLLQTRRSACPSSPPNLRVFHNTGYARRYHRALTFTPSSTPFASPDCVHLHGRLHPPKKGTVKPRVAEEAQEQHAIVASAPGLRERAARTQGTPSEHRIRNWHRALPESQPMQIIRSSCGKDPYGLSNHET